MKRALALLPALICAGCLGADQPLTGNLDTLALAPAAPAATKNFDKNSSSQPIVTLPPETASIAGVSRRWEANGFSERIRLTTDARKPASQIDVAIQTKAGGPAAQPSGDTIRAELAREFPGVSMQVAPPGDYRNAYGEFGLAIGRQGEALRCIYVWQYIEDARLSFANGERIAAKGEQPAPASLRMKLCRTDMTVDELASAASRIEVALPEDFAVRRRAFAPAEPSDAPPVRTATREPAPVQQAYAAGYATPVRAASPEGQRFLASPAAAPSYGAATGGGGNLPPQAFSGPSAGPPPN